MSGSLVASSLHAATTSALVDEPLSSLSERVEVLVLNSTRGYASALERFYAGTLPVTVSNNSEAYAYCEEDDTKLARHANNFCSLLRAAVASRRRFVVVLEDDVVPTHTRADHLRALNHLLSVHQDDDIILNLMLECEFRRGTTRHKHSRPAPRAAAYWPSARLDVSGFGNLARAFSVHARHRLYATFCNGGSGCETPIDTFIMRTFGGEQRMRLFEHVGGLSERQEPRPPPRPLPRKVLADAMAHETLI